MGFSDQSTQQKFPFDFDRVFGGVVQIIPRIGFTLKSQDKVIGRITASTGMSALSWGENITINVEKIDDNSTLVVLESALKLGANYQGQHRHQKNFDKIIQGLSGYLQGTTQKPSGESNGVVSSNNKVAGRNAESRGRPAEISLKGKKKKSKWVLLLVGLLLVSCVLCGVISTTISNKMDKNRVNTVSKEDPFLVTESKCRYGSQILAADSTDAKMKEALLVTVIDKAPPYYQRNTGRFADYIDLKVTLKNTSTKTIEGINGLLEIKDANGTLLARQFITFPELGKYTILKPRRTHTLKYEFKAPEDEKEKERRWYGFAGTELSGMKIVWKPDGIYWSDGTEILSESNKKRTTREEQILRAGGGYGPADMTGELQD